MAWVVNLISGVSERNNNDFVAVIEGNREMAEEVANLILEIYNREFPEYSHYVLGEVADGPVRVSGSR